MCSIVVLIPKTGVPREATTALASALGNVRFVVVERFTAAGVDRWAMPDQPSATSAAEAEAEAIAGHFTRDTAADRLVIVGQGDGAQVAVELARRLAGQAEEATCGAASGRVSAVVVASALPPLECAWDKGLLDIPLHVWTGADDLPAPVAPVMLGWRAYTDAATTFRVFDGSDDFLLTQVGEVAVRLRRMFAAQGEPEVPDVY